MLAVHTSANQAHVQILHFFMPQLNPLFAQFEFLSCDNTQLLLWLNLGTKNTWLGLGKGSIMD